MESGACVPTTSSTQDLFQKEDKKKEYCTCEEGETSTEYVNKVCMVQPIQRLPGLIPTNGKNFIFKPIDPAEIDSSDDDKLPSLPCDEILTISSDPDLEEHMLKLDSDVVSLEK